MGTVYIAICRCKGKILNGLVKVGSSSNGNLMQNMNNGTTTYQNDIVTHECYAYFVSKHYQKIENRLHNELKEYPANDIMIDPDGSGNPSPSKTHYGIPIESVFDILEKAITSIESKDFTLSHYICPCCNACYLYLVKIHVRKERVKEPPGVEGGIGM